MDKVKVLLIDGHNALWRASVKYGKPIKHDLCSEKYHTDKHIDELHCICGSPWNEFENFCYGDKYFLVYNFFRNLRPIIEKFKPNKCFFVLEGHPQFRYDLYPEYKQNRFIKKAEVSLDKISFDEFHEQKRIVINLLKYLPITLCKANDFEADDVIYSLCEDMKNEDIIILSNDSDFMQILQKDYSSVNIYNPIKKEFMVAPEYHYVGWKSLNGDKSDNIEKLLTPAKALKTINDPKLLQKFLNLDENRYLFNRNRKLIEFSLLNVENLIYFENDTNFDKLKQELNKMRFHSITNETSWNKYVDTFKCLNL